MSVRIKIKKHLMDWAKTAKEGAYQLSLVSTDTKNQALDVMADALEKHCQLVLKANQKDILAAIKNHLSEPMLNRLTLTDKKVYAMAQSLRDIAKLKDPVGRILSQTVRPNGLRIQKVSAPIGVIMIIYESRPNVTADCMALCLKSSNAVILKGGKEAYYSNKTLYEILSKAAYHAGVPKGAFVFVDSTDRQDVEQMLTLNEWIDLVIPRGGEGLIRKVVELSRIPVIKHYKGVCHTFVDESADVDEALKIILNAKTQNPSACNAMESLLVHKKIAKTFLPKVSHMFSQSKVEIRADQKALMYMPQAKAAKSSDWGAEYLALILSVAVVEDVKEAVEHIRHFGSSHSDAILTQNEANAVYFQRAVDSACVFVNSSTRLNDGGEFGMGAEMGISTDKLHARGPMGLEELTTYKYWVVGNGQIRQ